MGSARERFGVRRGAPLYYRDKRTEMAERCSVKNVSFTLHLLAILTGAILHAQTSSAPRQTRETHRFTNPLTLDSPLAASLCSLGFLLFWISSPLPLPQGRLVQFRHQLRSSASQPLSVNFPDGFMVYGLMP
jgi:hypothetical protein